MNSHRRAVITAATLMIASGFVAGTGASFNARTTNSGASASVDALTGPTGGTLTPTLSGNDVVFNWTGTLGSPQSGTGATLLTHRVLAKPSTAETGGDNILNGNNPPTCTAGATTAFTNVVATSANNTATTATGTGYATVSNTGGYTCFELVANAGTLYSQSPNIAAVAQIGHAVKSVVAANGGGGGGAGKFDTSDSITITFLQGVDTSTASNIPTSTNVTTTAVPTSGNPICVVNTAPTTIWFGRATLGGVCAQTETVALGSITGLTHTTNAAYNATYTWSGCTGTSCTILTAQARGRFSGTQGTTSLTNAFFTPTAVAGKLKSALPSVASGVAICTAANTSTATCQPKVTGTF